MMLIAAAVLAGSVAVTPRAASAEGLFDFLFGGAPRQQQRQAPPQANFFADPFGLNQQPAPPPRQMASGSGPAFCVRSCDGKYFPLMRGNASPVQMCQAFCPASVTKVFFGSSIEGASSGTGERYADSENAFAYRKALRADCTCNGRDPAGLAPVDLTLDTSLRSGDVIATTSGLVAYTGVKLGAKPDRRIHPGCFLSGPHRRCPRPARRNEGGAGERRNGRRRRAAAGGKQRRRAARDRGAESRSRPGRSAPK